MSRGASVVAHAEALRPNHPFVVFTRSRPRPIKRAEPGDKSLGMHQRESMEARYQRTYKVGQ